MKRFWIATGLVAALAAAVIVATATAATSSKPRDRVLSYGLKFSPFFLLDFSAHGVRTVTDIRRSSPSKGDQTIFDDRVTDHGRVVGMEAGSCVATLVDVKAPVPITLACNLTIKLPGGEIAAQGLASNAPVKRLMVVGGTGEFADKNGRVTITEFSSGSGRLVIRLRDA